MKKGRIVDLSHRLIPGKEEYHLKLKTKNIAGIYSQYKIDEGVWYIMQDIEMSSHCGTHIEFPYHHKKDGMDAALFPLEKLIGEGVLLDFTHKKPGNAVTLGELKLLKDKVSEGDILLFNFSCAKYYRTDHSHDRPYITHDAIKWLIYDRKISIIGSDASGIEIKGVPNQPNHQILMDNGIPIIEFAANLDQLRKERFTLFILTLSIEGLDSCPVRLVAIENI